MTWLATLAVATMACGRGGGSPPVASNRSTGGGQTGAGSTGVQGDRPCDGSVTLVVRGVDAGSLTSFMLDLASVTLTADGVALRPDWSAAGTTLSLAGSETPMLAAVKRVAGPVDVAVTFGNVLACTTAGCTTLDTCTAPITFRYDVDRAVPDGCHVFLELDLAASVQPTSSRPAFLPRFSAKYW